MTTITTSPCRTRSRRIAWSAAVAPSLLPSLAIVWGIGGIFLGPDPHAMPAGSDYYLSYDAHEESSHLGVTVIAILLSYVAGIAAVCHTVWIPTLPNNEKLAWAIGLLALAPVALPAYCWSRRRAIPRKDTRTR